MRGCFSGEVDSTGPGFSVPGIGHKALLGEDGGHAHVLVAILGEVPKGVESGMFPFLKELFPELKFIGVSFEDHSSSGS